jgi:tRNA threonylcarbamoyladenosine biosynthesis protein TsaB
MDSGQVLGEIRLACSVQHSERLFRSVEYLFDYVPFTLADIDLFVAARGPGSFTGLRLGLAAMEGFAAAHGKPGAGVSTLEALAWKSGPSGVEGRVIAPVIDARRGEVYGGLYRREGDVLTEMQPAVVMKPEDWFGSLPATAIVFCGDGALRYREFMTRDTWSLHEMDLYLAAAAARLAESPARGPLAPLYIRRTEAEVARERAL